MGSAEPIRTAHPEDLARYYFGLGEGFRIQAEAALDAAETAKKTGQVADQFQATADRAHAMAMKSYWDAIDASRPGMPSFMVSPEGVAGTESGRAAAAACGNICFNTTTPILQRIGTMQALGRPLDPVKVQQALLQLDGAIRSFNAARFTPDGQVVPDVKLQGNTAYTYAQEAQLRVKMGMFAPDLKWSMPGGTDAPTPAVTSTLTTRLEDLRSVNEQLANNPVGMVPGAGKAVLSVLGADLDGYRKTEAQLSLQNIRMIYVGAMLAVDPRTSVTGLAAMDAASRAAMGAFVPTAQAIRGDAPDGKTLLAKNNMTPEQWHAAWDRYLTTQMSPYLNSSDPAIADLARQIQGGIGTTANTLGIPG